MDDVHILALQTLKLNKQAIIFVPSRASAEKTAEDISKLVDFKLPELEKEVLKVAGTPTRQCKRLSGCIKKGIAFHHAGLLQKQKDLIEEEFKSGKIKIICATPTLCLSGDTEIWQEDKNTLVKNFGSSPLFALSQGNKLTVMKAKKVIKNKNFHKLIEITSVSGYFVKLTPNHKILIKRKNKKQLVEAAECQKNDKIATVGKLNITKTTKPKINNFVIDNKSPIEDRRLTEDDFYFIGSMLGDGHSGIENRNAELFYKGSPTFTSGDLESIELIENISKMFDSFSKRIERFGSISLVLSKKKWFREFLCRTGVDIGKHKSISSTLMQADLGLVASLLQGLFDTDGCVERRGSVSFSNISITLIKNIQKLLLRFGVVSRLRRRKPVPLNITGKEYQTKESFELTIAQNRSICLFNQYIGFRLKRKQESLNELVKRIPTTLYVQCERCNYKIYKNLFSGRTKEQKRWGQQKLKVIKTLGERGELGSRELKKIVGFEPKKKDLRLNHHYEFISKRRIGSRSNTEWFWSLNELGLWFYKFFIKNDRDLGSLLKINRCPLCKESFREKLRKKWRDSDFDGDIFWDYVRSVKEVGVEGDVYDVVLPDKPSNDHMFVANGFIVHNSAGLSLPVYRVIIKSLKRFTGRWGMDWIPVLEYLQMAGRAGRPEYEKFGEAIVIAKNHGQKEEIYERYVCGSPEEIYSKLAVEPVLRTYLLSLISSGIIRDQETMRDFFAKTFWAYQFKDMQKLELIMDRMLSLLHEWDFVDVVGSTNDFVAADSLGEKKLRATAIGRRISELYLDPLTAKHLIDCLKNFNKGKNTFSLLQMISHTLELRPLLRIKSKEQDSIQQELVKNYDYLLQEEPSAYDFEYDEFIKSIKTSLFFEAWINEKDEDYLLENYDVRPGEIRYKLNSADWLLYASEELAKLLELREVSIELRKLRLRVKFGAKEELLTLLKLQGVGRIRARKLCSHGLKNLGDLKKVDLTSLSQIVGKSIALSVKKQIGEEIKEVPKGKRKGQVSILKF